VRIGFVVGRFPSLSETFVISQMSSLLRRGFQVDVVCNGIADDEHLDRHGEPLATLLAKTRDWWGPAARLRPVLSHVPARLGDKISTVFDAAFARHLNKCDVVVAHFGHNGARVARLKKRNVLKPPMAVIFHGYDVGVPAREADLSRYRDLFCHDTLCLTVNDFFRRMLIEAGAPEANVAVHHMGIDPDAIPYAWRSWRDGPLKLISVCRLTEKKGVEFALRALAMVAASDPGLDWRYTVIGDGPLRASLEALASDLGIDRRVEFLGSLPHAEVKQRLRRAHAFILPSVTASNGDVEGIPVALMEAMAAGLTVVSTYHSGIPELIQDGETGFLAPERDAATLASRLAWIAGNPDSCEPIARAARRRVEADFNSHRLDEDFAGIVTRLAETRAAA
jgi:colanic acid/amylovoran biosynthesis glycosyltransferase